jgi:hypothetical protein
MNLQRLLERLPWSRSRTQATVEHTEPARVPVVEAVAPPAMPRLDRLDLQEAIIHHLEWCVLFNEHLSIEGNKAQHQTPLPGAQDSALGRWLSGMAQREIGQHPGFIELQQEHLRFHALARQALEYTRQQRMDLASTLLNTAFERSRARVLEMLRGMQKG